MARGPWTEVGPGHREIDLHGMERSAARRAVLDAIESCRAAGVKRLRIVHGKGTGVLREEVRLVLSEHLAVADFRTARPRDGGEGAVEVWLEGGARRGPIRG